jgi:hypothetical protein
MNDAELKAMEYLMDNLGIPKMGDMILFNLQLSFLVAKAAEKVPVQPAIINLDTGDVIGLPIQAFQKMRRRVANQDDMIIAFVPKAEQ